MSKIAFLGDPHIQFSNPSNRIDNYFLSVTKKWLQVLDANDAVVDLGDTFSNPVLDIQGTMFLISKLREFQEEGSRYINLLGNHPIYNWTVGTVGKTTTGLLASLGLIKILDRSGEVPETFKAKKKIEIDGWTIIPTLLNTPKEDIPDAPTDKSILVGHNYYGFERDKKHSLSYEDLKNKGYRYVFLGHDHEPHKPVIIENEDREPTILYRPGSLGREAAHAYNFTRKIIYYQLDTETGKVMPVDVEFEPANEVFSLEVIAKREDHTPAYIYDMEELMASFKKKSTVKVSIKKMMENNPEIPQEIIDFLEECHEACGLAFV